MSTRVSEQSVRRIEANELRVPMSRAQVARTRTGDRQCRKWYATVHIEHLHSWGDKIISDLEAEYAHGRLGIQFACAGWERGSNPLHTNSLHLQMFIIFADRKRCVQVMDLLGAFDERVQSTPVLRTSWPIMTKFDGNDMNGLEYCSKDSPTPYTAPGVEGMFWFIGDKPTAQTQVSQGTRTDVRNVHNYIRENPHASDRDLAENGHALVLWRNPQGTDRLRAAYQQRRERGDRVVVYWYWGPSGTGKSHTAYEQALALGATADDIYYKMRGKWYDGYHGQKYIIVDDFRPGGRGFTFDDLLRLVDSYRLRVEYKGGSTYMNGRFFFFTSIFRWDDPRMLEWGNNEAIYQLQRRITHTMKFAPRTMEERRGQIYHPPVEEHVDILEPGPPAPQAPGFTLVRQPYVPATPVRVVPETPTRTRARDPVADTLERSDTLELEQVDTLVSPRRVRRRLSL